MPPELVINRFAGLSTSDDPDDGDLTALTRAENVIYDNAGAVISRPGIRFYLQSNNVIDSTIYTGGVTQQKTYYVGELRFNDGFVYQFFNAEPVKDPNTGGQFFWGNTVGTGQSSTVSSGSPTVGGLFDTFNATPGKKYGVCKVPGAQYNHIHVLPNGKMFRMLSGVLSEDVASGFPVFSDGWGSMCTHKARTFAAPKLVTASGTTPARVYFSNEQTASTYAVNNYILVGEGQEDQAITCIVPYQGRLIVFKTGGMWVVETTGAPSSWSIKKISDKGAVGRCVAVHDTGIFWAGPKGVFKWDGTSFTDLTGPILNVFDRDKVIDDMDCNGVIYNDRFVFYVVQEDGTRRFFVFDIAKEQYSELTTVLEGLGYQIVNFFVREKRTTDTTTMSGANNTFKLEKYGPPGIYMTMKTTGSRAMIYSLLDINPGSDATFLSTGTPPNQTERGMTVTVQTKFSDLEEPILKKRVHLLALEWDGPATTVSQIDEDGRTKADVLASSDGSSFTKIGGIGFVRKLSLKIVTTGTLAKAFKIKKLYGKVSVQGNQISNQASQYD